MGCILPVILTELQVKDLFECSCSHLFIDKYNFLIYLNI